MGDFHIVDNLGDLGAENGLRRAREVFKKVPGGRSSVLTEYEPVGSHGDPVYGQNYVHSLK